MTLVSSANTGSDKEFILRGKSFIYIMKNSGPWTDPISGKVWKEMKLQILLHNAVPTVSFVALNYTSGFEEFFTF
jgi:hypothetical protein